MAHVTPVTTLCLLHLSLVFCASMPVPSFSYDSFNIVAEQPLRPILSRAQESEIKNWIIDIRRHLHSHPETMYEEKETNAFIRSKLDELDIPYDSPIAETGIVAMLGKREGPPTVLLRADMDALNLEELAAVDFKSRIPGKMHACGHDAHVAMLLGAARLLKEREASIPGSVRLVFQPAEEGGAGARRMLEEGGTLGDAGAAFALHVDPTLPTGAVASRPGLALGTDASFEVTVTGQGGHGAMPHLSQDPVVAAAHIITSLQTLVSRELSPLASGVVSVTMVHGGTALNVIPGSVKLGGTLRALSMESINFLKERFKEVATLQARTHRCTADVNFDVRNEPPYPATINDKGLYELFVDTGEKLLGEGKVHLCEPELGVEDFSFFAQATKGLFVNLGVRNESIGAVHGLHSPYFILDEDALPIGAALHVAMAMRYLTQA